MIQSTRCIINGAYQMRRIKETRKPYEKQNRRPSDPDGSGGCRPVRAGRRAGAADNRDQLGGRMTVKAEARRGKITAAKRPWAEFERKRQNWRKQTRQKIFRAGFSREICAPAGIKSAFFENMDGYSRLHFLLPGVFLCHLADGRRK